MFPFLLHFFVFRRKGFVLGMGSVLWALYFL